KKQESSNSKEKEPKKDKKEKSILTIGKQKKATSDGFLIHDEPTQPYNAAISLENSPVGSSNGSLVNFTQDRSSPILHSSSDEEPEIPDNVISYSLKCIECGHVI